MTSSKPFISYSRRDTDTANKIVEILRSNGFDVWIDQKIRTGETWDQTVERNIKECDIFIVIMSESSVKSPNVMDEVSFAIGLNKRILPIKIEDAEIPMRLARYQYIDVDVLGMEKAMETLIYDMGHLDEVIIPPSPVESSSSAKQSSTIQQPARKKKNNKLILIGLGIIAVIVILILTDVLEFEDASDDFDVNMVEMATSDEEAWASAESIGTYKAYLDYHSKYYDNGKYKKDANDRMNELANTTGVTQYSEGTGASKENYFHLYQAGSDITETPEEGNYVIAVVDSSVNVASPDGQTTITIKENEVGVVRSVQVVDEKVYITINFHSK